jgi:hypothetical protein
LDTLRHVLKGRRSLPVKHWGLFYEWKDAKKKGKKQRTTQRTKTKPLEGVSDRLKALSK